AKTGRCEGRKPYGYYPGEEDVIKRIRELARKPHGQERMGCRAIARQLNEEGVCTRSGVPWSGTQVRSILSRKT
ncbi:recombinase family protein, partial [Planctomycetota bacterium]